MKITAIDTCVLAVPTPKPMALNYPFHKMVVAEISTDEGVKGLGYSLAFNGGGAEAVHTYLETRLKPALIGEDPSHVERLWEKMFRVDMGVRKQGIAGYALSALDIGLWDIVGKLAKQPLYKLWGAHSDRVAAYGSGGWNNYSVADLVGEAEKYAAMGCRYYKMKIHHPDPRENAKRVAAVHKALGGKAQMMVDVNQRLDVLGNVRQAELLEEFDLLWYEEPVLADDLDGYAEVARKITFRSRRARTTSPAGSSSSSSSATRSPSPCPTCAAPAASRRRCASASSPPRTACSSRRISSTKCRSTSSAPSPTASWWSSWTGRRPTCGKTCRSARTGSSASPTGRDTA
jgi:hypothetical protein